MDGSGSHGERTPADVDPREATQDYSSGSAARPVRLAGLLLSLLAVVLLVAAELSTLYEIRVVTAVPAGGSETAGGNHAYALMVIAAVALVMLVGAWRGGSRPAAAALVALALAALFVCLAIDLPDARSEGLIGERYDQAEAKPQSGFFLETGGAIALLVGGVALTAFPAPAPRRTREREDRRTEREARRAASSA